MDGMRTCKMGWLLAATICLGGASVLGAKDISSQFIKSYQRATALEAGTLAKPYHVVIVPGLFDSIKRPFYSITRDYADYKTWFKKHRVSYEILSVHSQRAPTANHYLIKKAIEHSDKKVVIIAHSYGGLFSTSTLLQYPALQKKLAGLITMQTPFYGSKIVEKLKNNWILAAGARLFFWALAGSWEGFAQLSETASKLRLDQHRVDITMLTRNVPTFHLATKDDVFSAHRILGIDIENGHDGLVETDSQYLRFGHSSYALLNGWSHTDTMIANNKKPDQSRHALLAAMLHTVLAPRDTDQ